MSVFALLTFGVLARCAICRTFEMHIAFPALAALTKNEVLSVAGKIDKRLILELISRKDDCSNRYFDNLVRASAAMHFLPHSVAAAFRLDHGLVEKR